MTSDLPSALSRVKAALELASKATPGPLEADGADVVCVECDKDGDPIVIVQGRSQKRKGGMIGACGRSSYSYPTQTTAEANAKRHAALVNCVPDIRALVEACEGAKAGDLEDVLFLIGERGIPSLTALQSPAAHDIVTARDKEILTFLRALTPTPQTHKDDGQ